MSVLLSFSRRDLACREAVALLTDYLEGALSRRERRRLEGHLTSCPHCTEFLAQLRDTIRGAREIDHEAIGDHTRDELVAMYRRWRAE